jgi:hypothetical protein
MQSLVRAAVVALVVGFASQCLPASEVAGSRPTSGMVVASAELPILIGQTTSNSSSSGGSTRIPRGVIRLAIFGGIALLGAAGWVIKKLTAA